MHKKFLKDGYCERATVQEGSVQLVYVQDFGTWRSDLKVKKSVDRAHTADRN